MQPMEIHYRQVLACFCKYRLNPGNEYISDRILFHHVADEMGFPINNKDRPTGSHAMVSKPATDTCYDYEPDMMHMVNQLGLDSEYPYWSFVFDAYGVLVWHSVMVG